MTPQIHAVVPDDWRSHRGLRLEMLQDTPDAFWTTYAEIADRTEAQWRASLRGPARFWKARDCGGDVLGSVGLVPHRTDLPDLADAAWIIAMYVRPPARRAGIGGQLLDTAARTATAWGRRRLLLEVTSNNVSAIALYRRTGFGFTGAQVPHPRRADLTEREMVRILT